MCVYRLHVLHVIYMLGTDIQPGPFYSRPTASKLARWLKFRPDSWISGPTVLKPARWLANSKRARRLKFRPDSFTTFSKPYSRLHNFLVSAPALAASYSLLAPALAIMEWARPYL